jgi:hypothetical protein
MAADTTAPALAPPPNGCLASVVTAYHCAVRHQKYTWDFMFDVAPPRNLPHPDCPGRPGGGRCVMAVGPAPTPHCDRPGCRSQMTILGTHSAHGARQVAHREHGRRTERQDLCPNEPAPAPLARATDPTRGRRRASRTPSSAPARLGNAVP